MFAEDSRKLLAKGRERKAQARAADVASRGADADERAARRTNLRTRLIVSAPAKKSAKAALPALQSPLPLIRKRQFSSLRATHRVPIIQNSQLFTVNEELWAPPWTNSKNSAAASM